MFVKTRWIQLLALLAVPMMAVDGQDKRGFSQPDSVLLFGTYGDLQVVTPSRVFELRPPVEFGYNHGYFVNPGIAPQSDFIAWGFAVESRKDRTPHSNRFALGIYCMKTQQWKAYGDFDRIGTPAFTPDGSKIAFVALDPATGYHLLTFDVATEKMTIANVDAKGIPGRGGIPEKATLGWAPDSKRLVVELQGSENPSQIVVLDLNSGEMRPIGAGTNPAWSPTGEWIAYYDLSGEKCLLVHPDGTNAKTVKNLGPRMFGHRRFGYAIVWSPDGKQLLLNEMKGDGDYLDVVLVDIENSRSTTKAKNCLPVFGWVARRE